MTRRTLIAVLGAAVVVAVAAGCSGGPVAAPASTTPVPASSAAALPHSGAPKVERPLPASVLSGPPCQEALTSDQLKQIFGMVPQGKPDTLPGIGPECDWSNPDSGAGLSVYYATQPHHGLSGLYRNSKPQAKVWRVLPPIQGFPAIAFSTDDAETSIRYGLCQVSVGIADDLTVDLGLTPGEAKMGKVDPCVLSERVAGMVVTNLKRKAGA